MKTEIGITTWIDVISGIEPNVEIEYGVLHPNTETTILVIDSNTTKIDLTHCFNLKEIIISQKSHSLIIYCDTEKQLELIKNQNPKNTICYTDGNCNGPYQFHPINIWETEKINSEYKSIKNINNPLVPEWSK